MLDVRGARDERGELRDPRLTADPLEVTALVELVRQGDGVHRLALGPQSERREEDLRVALPVEVRRVEDLARRTDRGRREQHGAEYRLLGFEILRRHDRARRLGGTGEGEA